MDIQRTEVTREETPEQCILEKYSITSPSMQREIRAITVLPPAYAEEPDRIFPVLYTLHGAGAPYDTWAQMSRLRLFIKEQPFIYTCFDGDNRSMYLDSVRPLVASRKPEEHPEKVPSKFTTFFFDEFVPAIDAWYRVDPDQRAVTGFSMGGFGAYYYMLCRPDMFTSVSGLSSAFFDTGDMSEGRRDILENVIGPRKDHEEEYRAVDHYLRVEKCLQNRVKLPPIYQACGTGDFLIEHNRKMAAFARDKGLDYTYDEGEGDHTWQYWHPMSVKIAEFHWKNFFG